MLTQAAHQVLRHDVGRQDEQDDEVGHCQSRQVAVGGPEMPGRRSYNDQGSGLGHDDFVDPREKRCVLPPSRHKLRWSVCHAERGIHPEDIQISCQLHFNSKQCTKTENRFFFRVPLSLEAVRPFLGEANCVRMTVFNFSAIWAVTIRVQWLT